MRIIIAALFIISMMFFGWAKWIDHRPPEVASVSPSIVPLAFGALVFVADLALLAVYALWRLFT